MLRRDQACLRNLVILNLQDLFKMQINLRYTIQRLFRNGFSMATEYLATRKKNNTRSEERQFKGLSLTERKELRQEKLIEAGIATYGTHGFFCHRQRCL